MKRARINKLRKIYRSISTKKLLNSFYLLKIKVKLSQSEMFNIHLRINQQAETIETCKFEAEQT